MRNRFLFFIGLTILLLLVTAALMAPFIAPYNPTEQNLEKDLLPPSQEHFMGPTSWVATS